MFEDKTSVCSLLGKIQGYCIEKNEKFSSDRTFANNIFFNRELVAQSFPKNSFYKFLKEKGVNYKDHISKKLLPDDALLIIIRKTLFIIEVKFQEVAGSVDEKLQTCDFKRKQYSKLVKSL